MHGSTFRHDVYSTRTATQWRALQRLMVALPRGRGRVARFLAGKLRKPFVARVPPFELDVLLTIDPSDAFQLEIWLGAYQPHVINFLTQSVRHGDAVLCAGLHVGYTVAIARRLAAHGVLC